MFYKIVTSGSIRDYLSSHRAACEQRWILSAIQKYGPVKHIASQNMCVLLLDSELRKAFLAIADIDQLEFILKNEYGFKRQTFGQLRLNDNG